MKHGPCIPARYQIIVMIFLGSFLAYMLRADFSIFMLEMAVSEEGEETYCATASPENQTIIGGRHGMHAHEKYSDFIASRHSHEEHEESESLFRKLNPFDWPRDVQARLRSAYFWGYVVMNLIGERLAESFGSRLILMYAYIITSVLMLVFPFSAYMHYSCVYMIRIIIGLSAAAVFPAMQALASNWAIKKDKGKFSLGFLAGSMGSVVAMPFAGYICIYSNWMVAAITTACISAILTVTLFVFIRDYPEQHPFISADEIAYLREELPPPSQKKKKIVPYVKICGTLSFWAFAFLRFGNIWAIFFLLTSQPQYMKEVMGIDIHANSYYSCFPHLARVIFGVLFSYLGEFLLKKNMITVPVMRKTFTIISHLIPGALLIAVAFVPCSVYGVSLLTTLTLGCNGAATLTAIANAFDLSPRFARAIFGLANCIASGTGIIVGEIVGYLTKKKTGRELMKGWAWVFVISGIVSFISGLVFICFGSAQVQSYEDWVEESDTPDEPSESDKPASKPATPTPAPTPTPADTPKPTRPAPIPKPKSVEVITPSETQVS